MKKSNKKKGINKGQYLSPEKRPIPMPSPKIFRDRTKYSRKSKHKRDW